MMSINLTIAVCVIAVCITAVRIVEIIVTKKPRAKVNVSDIIVETDGDAK